MKKCHSADSRFDAKTKVIAQVVGKRSSLSPLLWRRTQEEYQSRAFKASTSRVKEQWLARRGDGGVLPPRSARVDRVALEANGVTTPLSRHGKVSSPPRRKLIPNPSGWTSTNNFGSPPRLFRVTAFSFHRARTGLSSPLPPSPLASSSCFRRLLPSLISPSVYPSLSPSLFLVPSATTYILADTVVCSTENRVCSRSYREPSKTQSIPVSASGRLEIVSKLQEIPQTRLICNLFFFLSLSK